MVLSEYKWYECLGRVWCNWGKKRFQKQTPTHENAIFEKWCTGGLARLCI